MVAVGPAAFAAATGIAPAGSETPAPAAATFTVQIIGRVDRPGTYVLGEGARLWDALAAAGMTDADAAGAGAGVPIDGPGCTSGGADLHRVYLTRAVESAR